MATPYEVIFNKFLSKISDYEYINLSENELYDELEDFLKSSIPKFTTARKLLSNRDETLKQFNSDLDDYVVETLVTLMMVEYLSPKIYESSLLKQSLSSKDYAMYSQANHIKQITDLRDKKKQEAKRMVTEYTYLNLNMDDLI